MERTIAVEVTNMTYNLLLLYQLSYLAILPPITVKHLSKVFGLNFTLQQKEAKWELAFNVVVGEGKQELLVLIRWTIDGLIAGGGFEPPSLAKETRKKPLLYPAMHCLEEPFQARSLIDY